MTSSVSTGALTAKGALRVPQITAGFWILKGLSTAMGEATSDFLVHVMNPALAVVLGFFGFVVALSLQLHARCYRAWNYWFGVVMVGVFGTMAADVLHVALGVPYVASFFLYAAVLAAVFLTWHHFEPTLSIHDVDTTRRELFYWSAVVATFAMGTALGDLTATTLGLGYFSSIFLFAGVILIPAVAFWRRKMNAVLAFWFAYVMTRPLGASVADWTSKPKNDGSLNLGDGSVSLVLTLIIVVFVACIAHEDQRRARAVQL